MTRERYIKLIAGTLVLISSLCAYFVNINWIWLGVFVGANLFQFSLTNWCIMNSILKALGLKSELDCSRGGGC
jgi:hypothetical protein